MVRLQRVTVGVVLLILMTMVYVMADWVYGPYAAMVRNTMVIYFILFVFMMSAFQTGMPLIGTNVSELSSFVIGFLITAVVLLLVPLAGLAGEVSYETVKMALGFGILHGFIKAYIEEGVFRDILLKRLGMWVSNGLFGMFHVGMVVMSLNAVGSAVTLQAVAVPVAVLVGLGFAWTFMAQRFGLMSAVGSHLAWNLNAFGVLGKVVGVS